MNTLNSQKRNPGEESRNWSGPSRSTTATRRMLKPGQLRFRLIAGSTISEKNIVDGYWCTSYGRFQRCFCNAERETVNRLHKRKRDRLIVLPGSGAIWRMLTSHLRKRISTTCGRSSIRRHSKRSSICSYTSVISFWLPELLQPPALTNAPAR